VKLNRLLQLVFVGLVLASGVAQAQSVEQRVQRLERLLDNSALISMLQRIDTLQDEVRQLRGEMEQRDNALTAMRERQRKLYLDTDDRIASLEGGGGGSLDNSSIKTPTICSFSVVTAKP